MTLASRNRMNHAIFTEEFKRSILSVKHGQISNDRLLDYLSKCDSSIKSLTLVPILQKHGYTLHHSPL